jgi:hypothetical protein
MQIRRLSGIQWNDSLSICASEGYLSSYSDDYGWLSDQDSNLFIPFRVRERLSFRELVFECDVDSFIESSPVSVEEKREFLKDAVRYAREVMKIDNIAQPPSHAVFQVAPVNSISVPFGSYRIDLSQSSDDMWNNVHSKHKNVIRKSEKSGVVVKSGIEHLDVAAELVSETLKRSGLKSHYAERLSKKLSDHIAAYICEHDGKLQGSAIFLFSKKGALYMWGGSIDSPFTGAVNFLHWNAIRDFKNMGVKCYDFVGARINPVPGSKTEGLQRFKSRFGASLYQGYLWKYPMSWKCGCYSILRKYYLRMNGRSADDVIDQELRLQAERVEK